MSLDSLDSSDSLENYKYYNYEYKGVKIDPYRIMYEYKITHPAHQHALKKLLRCGKSVKEQHQDIQEVIDSLTRWLAMIKEDELLECHRSQVIAEIKQEPSKNQNIIPVKRACISCKHDQRDGECHKKEQPHSFDCWPNDYVGWEPKT